jgi:glycosyltransferase involved in cell wall biosynthesis
VICAPYPFRDQDRASGDGLMQSVVTLAHALANERDVDVHVLSRAVRTHDTTTREIDGVHATWVPDPIPSVDYLLERSLLRRRFAKVLSDLQPDVVHAHGEPPFIQAALDHSAPHVVTLQGLFAQQTRAHTRAAPLAYRFAYAMLRRWEAGYLPRIRNLIAINNELADSVRMQSPNVRVFAIKNPVEASLLEVADAESRPTILFVGQLSRRKGVHLVLEAFDRLAGRHSDVQLRIVGDRLQDPAYAEGLERQYERYVRDARVVFTGPANRAQVAAELSRCSLLCLPSFYEASPVVVIEAMAAGKPVVATRAGDVDDLLGNGNAGLVVDVGDLDGLTTALETLLSDPAARREMGRRARETARRRAAPEAIARQTVEAYRQVLDAGGRNGHPPG